MEGTSPPGTRAGRLRGEAERYPGRTGPGDLGSLRDAGLSDPEIHDAVQVISYFNYINRIADALGTDLEPEMPARPTRWAAQ